MNKREKLQCVIAALAALLGLAFVTVRVMGMRFSGFLLLGLAAILLIELAVGRWAKRSRAGWWCRLVFRAGCALVLIPLLLLEGYVIQEGWEDLSAIEAEDGAVVVHRELGGYMQTLRVPLPAVLTVTRDLGVPRLPSIAGVLRSEKQNIPLCNAEKVQADPARCGLKGSPTQVVKTYLPQRSRQVTEISGTAEEQCGALLQIMTGV